MQHQQPLTDLLKMLSGKNTRKVKLAVVDIDGILRGKLISFDKFQSIAEKGFGFCNVVFGWDANDAAYDNADFTGWHTGYPDATAIVDINTFREIPWEDGLPFFLADFADANGESLPICPRSLLKKVIAEATAAGFSAFFSQEFEWFNFTKTDGQSTAIAGNLEHLSSGMFGYSVLRASQHSAFFHELFDLLTKFNVPVEGLHTETGPGVYEAAILYTNVLEAADRAVCFKTGVKEIASRHGITASFMAKFNEHLPGCSGHVHQSLWSADGQQNLFAGKQSKTGFSALMENYMAGQLHCLPHILPMFAPTVNSYKRLTEGAWAPTTVTWGIDNRTTALRALPAGDTATRLETRVVGSDANPYLAMAACLASGLYGIKNKLPLNIKATTGNGYTDTGNGRLPKTLWEATQAMKTSAIAKELFGDAFVQHFIGTREWEWRQFSKVVTDWELKRYFEII